MGAKIYTNGDRYKGDLKDDKRHGQGTLTYAQGGEYAGGWINDLRHGQGKFTYSDGGIYDGQWANDMREGQGTNTWANGNRYAGTWKHNRMHGQGTMTYKNGGKYSGQWSEGKRNGQGTNEWPDGERYEGAWRSDKKHGPGTLFKSDGTQQGGSWANNNWVEVKKDRVTPGCALFPLAQEFVEKLGWAKRMFNPKGDRCFCSQCYDVSSKDVIEAGGENYVIPRGFVRFGLFVDPVFSDRHDIWKKWIVTFHGTNKIGAESVIVNRQFCLPGDRLIDGSILGIREGHIPGKQHIYTSPTIAYSSSPVYSPAYEFVSQRDQKKYEAQIVLQCRQKPGSFKVQRETIGLGEKRICRFVPNEKMEYFTDIRPSIVTYGLLIRVRETH